MKLRPYQEEVKQKIYEAWESGAINVLAQLSTGAGKTVLMASVVQEHSKPTIAIAHRHELVSQISLTLAKHGLKHNIVAQKNTIREIISLHMKELGTSYYNPQSSTHVAGVDTLIRMSIDTPWFAGITLLIQDEAHHVLSENKWGKAAALFPQAKGLYLTATPVRADGKGLGRHADGLVDRLILGTSMRELIDMQYLTKYRVFAPPSDLDLSTVTISASGDYSPPKLRRAIHTSHITGDVVAHYQRIAPGKLGVTFAVDIESATAIAAEFRSAGILAEVISSKTPDLLRAQIMREFRNREILQIVNVDLLGEGVDVPAIEVVSMARPTASYSLFAQQFGRALRPMPGKPHAIIIDHVGNTILHGLPDGYREWSLDRRLSKRKANPDVIPLRNCLNIECMAVYEKYHKYCPICGHYPPPTQRSAPEYVDGDLTELDEETLAKMRGDIATVDAPPHVPSFLDPLAQAGFMKKHKQKQQTQSQLRMAIALWAGYYKERNTPDSEIYRRFYFKFGIDIMSAQVLNTRDATALGLRINTAIDEMDNTRVTYSNGQ